MRLVHFFLPALVLSVGTLTLAQSNLASGETRKAWASGPPSALAGNENGNARLRAVGNLRATSSSGGGSAATHSIRFPLAFEANRGQAPGDVDFVAAGRRYRAELRSNGIVLDLSMPADAAETFEKSPGHAVLRITLSGASPNPPAAGEDKLAGQTNYLFGSDPAKWITGVERYAKVRYVNVYPGIDVLFHGNQNRLEQDFVVHPGANPRRIRLGFDTGQRLELSIRGDLVLAAGAARVRVEKPHAYQLVGNQRVEVSAEYEIRKGYASFRLGPYNSRRELMIDPVLVYATFLGGETPAFEQAGIDQEIQGMAIDASGLYVTGSSSSPSFPVTSGVVGPTLNDGSTFVTKLDPTGQSLIFSTFVAGLSATAVAVDTSHNVYIAGIGVAGLPIPSGSSPFEGSRRDLAVLKLNSQGTAVLAATYLGGTGTDSLSGLVIDPTDNVYLTGTTNSSDFPVENPLQSALGTSGQNGFVTELNPGLSGLVYSTYLGANSDVSAPVFGVNQDIALDSSGDVYVVGAANAGFPVTSNAYESACATSSAAPCPFLAKLNPSGSAILYATYLGFNGDSAAAVAIDSSGDTYVAGATSSAAFPAVNPIQSCSPIEGSGTKIPSGNFLAEFNPSYALTFSTCLGINPVSTFGVYAFGPALALDTSGNVYFTASAQPGLPLKDPIDANPPASARPFVSEVSAATHQLVFSSFVAGPVTYDNTFAGNGEAISAITVDSAGNIYLAGISTAEMGYVSSSEITAGYSYLPVFNALESYFFNPFNNVSCPFLLSPCQATAGFIMEISPTAGAAAALVPAELQFPATVVGSTAAALAVTIYDLGTDPLSVSKVAASGDFAIHSNNCATVSASGGKCSIEVTFTPTALGTQNGTLTVSDSSVGSPHKVVLTGIALGLGLGIAAGGSSSATVAPGATAKYLLSIGGAGIGGTASLSCKGAPTGAACSIPGSMSVSATSATTFDVTVSTTPSTMGKLSPSRFLPSPPLWAMAMMGWVFLPQPKAVRRRSSRLFLLFLSAFLLGALCSCGSGGGFTPGPTSPGTYTLTVTAQIGNTSQSTLLTLTVQ